MGDSSTGQGTNAYIYSWSDVDLDWSDADTVVVLLVEAETVEASSNSQATGAPTISGTAQVGETLAADTTGIADDGLDSAAFSYQRLAADAEINGATASTHTLVAADAGNEETLFSAATASGGPP